jgi:hypothetical protein
VVSVSVSVDLVVGCGVRDPSGCRRGSQIACNIGCKGFERNGCIDKLLISGVFWTRLGVELGIGGWGREQIDTMEGESVSLVMLGKRGGSLVADEVGVVI